MCYKQEMQNRIFRNVDSKLTGYPDFIKDFFDRKKSAKTANSQFGFVKDLLSWLKDNNYITEITPAELDKVTSNHIIKYFKRLQMGDGCNPNSLESIGTKRAVFGSLWEYLSEQEYVRKNIIRQIPSNLFKAERAIHDIKIPSEEQLETFLDNVENNTDDFYAYRNIAIVRLIMGSGIRAEELIGLDLEDIHLDDETPYIEVLGKGNQQEKSVVKISQSAKYWLKKYLAVRDKINPKGINALFISQKSTRYSKGAIDNMFAVCSKGQISPHQLRHWVGTKLYADTLDIKLVQTQLRHKNLETAAMYYVKSDESKLCQAVWSL
jgi:site-specific recombinase XerD